MKNMMSMTDVQQMLQLEVAIPLAVGIFMLMYTTYFLFTYKEKSSGGTKKKAAAKKKTSAAEKPTRRSVRETKAPKVWGEEDEPKVRHSFRRRSQAFADAPRFLFFRTARAQPERARERA